MYVSSRCLFPKFTLTWLSVSNKEEYAPTDKFPKLTKELIKELNLENGIEWSMSAFLLESEGEKALFDAGFFDDRNNNKRGILTRLDELKISPDEINYIFITHFSWDHIDGLIDENDNMIYKNAKIYVSKEEYNAEIKKGRPDRLKLPERIKKLYGNKIIQFGFEETLPLGIIPIKAFGHTPGHTCYRKDELLIIGDLIHGEKVQFEYPEICTVYDVDEEQSIESRKRVLKYAKENKLFIAGHHLQFSNSAMYKKFYENK